MYASPSRLLPVAVDLFDYRIEKQGARHALNQPSITVQQHRLNQRDSR
jgi:hypothetical protein